ncbi:hypothetical protein B0H17DRAFT_1134436 [Mycena rosella]|uniref:Uncharacterized protein n=1 Tax=Mycena rosella TaxID=1033263 RepID=A0AAD7DFF1_MYCRO|nr:hypothetical protein B0H17DRAFT_1134436 [Mycena rosella]
MQSLSAEIQLAIAENLSVSDLFLSGLNNILKAVTQIRCLRLDIPAITIPSPTYFGHYVDPRYAETIFHHRFEHLEIFDYIIQGSKCLNGGDSLYLPSFLNNHHTLKKIKLTLSSSPDCKESSIALKNTLTLPQLESLDAPFGYFTTLQTPLLRTIWMKYSSDTTTVQTIRCCKEEAIRSCEEEFWVATVLPELQNIMVHRPWEYPNVELVCWIAQAFSNICSLEIQGHYWVDCDNDEGLPEALRNFTRLEIFQYGLLNLPANVAMFMEEEDAERNYHPQIAKGWHLECPSLTRIRINCWRCIFQDGMLVVVGEDWMIHTNVSDAEV